MAGRGISCERFPDVPPALIPDAGMEFRAVSDPFTLHKIAEPFGAAENNPSGINEPGMKTGSLVTSFVNSYYKLTDLPVLGISASKGGSSISMWQGKDDYLSDALKRLSSAQDFCCRHGITLRHQFLLWCQGETDGDHNLPGDEYVKLFTNTLRLFFNSGIEHCFLIGIGEYNGERADISYREIREAQYALCSTQTDVTLVCRAFETMKARGLMKDAFHYYQAGYNEAGAIAGRCCGEYVKDRVS